MLRPAIVLLAAWPALACRGEAPPASSVPSLPFADRAIEDRDFAMASAQGDTIWFRAADQDAGRVRLVRYRRSDGGMDSLAAVIDARSKRPLHSYQRLTTSDGIVTGEVGYGEGFQGQARLTVTSVRGQLVENLRTPEPYLDPAQLPQTLAALDLSRPDTITFNYVSPFEELARNALLVVGRRERLTLPSGPVPAYPVRLRVSGHEETWWFAAPSAGAPSAGARLLRWRDHRQNVTWDRVEEVP